MPVCFSFVESIIQNLCLVCNLGEKFPGCFLQGQSCCKQCLCAHKDQNTHGIENLPCVFCLLGCNPNPCKHHRTLMAAHSCRVLKERLAKNAKPASARCRTMGLGCAQQALATQVVFVYTKTLLAREFRCTRMVPRSTACKSDCVSPNCQFRLQLLYWTHQKFFRRPLP